MSGQLSRTNTIDANGSITNDGTVSYGYNAYGRMVSATVGGLTTTYALNGKGQRVSKSGASGTTLYLYDGAGHLIGEYDGANGNAIQETVWFGDLPAVLLTGTTASAAIYNIHADHLGAPKVITDQTGNTVWNWDHGPFGKGNPTGTLTYNLRFPGQYYDEESGLSYNMNRDYDPQTGRYVQSDPIGLEGGINTYGYVGQNPLWAVDPDGHMPVAVALVLAGGTMYGLFEMTGMLLDDMNKWNDPCSDFDGRSLEEVGTAFGKGFMAGTAGTAAGLAVGSATGNPWGAGMVASSTANTLTQLMNGKNAKNFDFESLALETAAGSLLGGMANKLIPTKGRLPSLLKSRSMSNYGPNSMRLLSREGASGVVGGALSSAWSSRQRR